MHPSDEYRSFVRRLRDGVITLLLVAVGVQWAGSVLADVVPLLIILIALVAVIGLAAGLYRHHRDW